METKYILVKHIHNNFQNYTSYNFNDLLLSFNVYVFPNLHYAMYYNSNIVSRKGQITNI